MFIAKSFIMVICNLLGVTKFFHLNSELRVLHPHHASVKVRFSLWAISILNWMCPSPSYTPLIKKLNTRQNFEVILSLNWKFVSFFFPSISWELICCGTIIHIMLGCYHWRIWNGLFQQKIQIRVVGDILFWKKKKKNLDFLDSSHFR